MAGAVLTAHEREEIRVGIEAKESLTDIARRLDRAPSTICREVDRKCPLSPELGGAYLTLRLSGLFQFLFDIGGSSPAPEVSMYSSISFPSGSRTCTLLAKSRSAS